MRQTSPHTQCWATCMFPDLDSFQLGISMSQLQPLAGNLQAISQGHIESDDPPPWTSRANELDVDLVAGLPRTTGWSFWHYQWMIGEEHLFPLRPLAGAETSPEHPPKVTWPSHLWPSQSWRRRWRGDSPANAAGSSWIVSQDVCALPHDSLFQWKIHELNSHMIDIGCMEIPLKAYLRTAWVKGWEHVRSCITYIILHILRSELGCNGSSTLGMSQNQGCIALLQFEPPMKWSTDRGVLLIFLEGLSGLPSKILRLRQQFVGHFQAETGGLMEGDCCLKSDTATGKL